MGRHSKKPGTPLSLLDEPGKRSRLFGDVPVGLAVHDVADDRQMNLRAIREVNYEVPRPMILANGCNLPGPPPPSRRHGPSGAISPTSRLLRATHKPTACLMCECIASVTRLLATTTLCRESVECRSILYLREGGNRRRKPRECRGLGSRPNGGFSLLTCGFPGGGGWPYPVIASSATATPAGVCCVRWKRSRTAAQWAILGRRCGHERLSSDPSVDGGLRRRTVLVGERGEAEAGAHTNVVEIDWCAPDPVPLTHPRLSVCRCTIERHAVRG